MDSDSYEKFLKELKSYTEKLKQKVQFFVYGSEEDFKKSLPSILKLPLGKGDNIIGFLLIPVEMGEILNV